MTKLRNLYSLSFLLAVCLLVLASCEDDFQKFEQKYVAFNTSSALLNESQSVATADGGAVVANTTQRVQVVRNSPDVSQPLTVRIEVTSQFLDETDFGAPGEDASDQFSITRELSNFTIPAGEYSAEFLIVTNNDLSASGNKEIKLEIVGTSDDSYNLGVGESNIRKELLITLVDDDCPIDLETDFVGKWKVVEFCAAPGSNNEGFCRTTGVVGQEVTLAKDPSDPIGATAILTGGIHKDPVTLKFNTCPKTVSIDGVYQLNFNQNSATAVMRTPDEPEEYGTGSYSEGSKRISIVFTYSNTNNLNFDEFIVTYEKVQ